MKECVVHDHTVDDFIDRCLFQMVKGKANVAFVATTTDGDVFGGFHTMAVTSKTVYLKA